MISRALMTLAGLALLAAPLAAQESGRILNGYHFIPSGRLPGPFAISYFGAATGGGLAALAAWGIDVVIACTEGYEVDPGTAAACERGRCDKPRSDPLQV